MSEREALRAQLQQRGYAQVPAALTRALLGTEEIGDFSMFSDSWDALGDDGYMADGGRYRKRRFAAFWLDARELVRKPHQPHYQSRDYNPLNGGVERWFEPVRDEVASHPLLRAVLRFGYEQFQPLTPSPPPRWHVEVHQFRIEASGDALGQPTPEGMHRDGVDWVLVMLVRRENVSCGETMLSDLAKKPIGGFTLTQPLELALVDDHRVFHGVTPIQALDPARAAYRDVLVVTYRRP